VIDLFDATQSRANSSLLSLSQKACTNPNREQKKTAVFAILELAEEKSQSSRPRKSPRWAQPTSAGFRWWGTWGPGVVGGPLCGYKMFR